MSWQIISPADNKEVSQVYHLQLRMGLRNFYYYFFFCKNSDEVIGEIGHVCTCTLIAHEWKFCF